MSDAPIRSMTGFGKGEAEAKDRKVTAELKSVNNRFLELQIRGVPLTGDLESKVSRLVREKIERGSLTLVLEVDDRSEETSTPQLNRGLVKAYAEFHAELSKKLASKEKLTALQLLTLPEVIRVRNRAGGSPVLEKLVLTAVDKAAEALARMREAEGRALARDLLQRIAAIEKSVDRIEALAPQRTQAFKEKLTARAEELFGGKLDDTLRSRLLMETMLQAEKADIAEELTRLRSHLTMFRETIKKGGGAGKRLNFIQQEIYRESNTVASKSGDTAVTVESILIREESEKIREQIQNLE